MSVEEAGRLLNVSRASAYAAARRGEIPVISVGRLKRVPIAAFNAMLEAPQRKAGVA